MNTSETNLRSGPGYLWAATLLVLLFTMFSVGPTVRAETLGGVDIRFSAGNKILYIDSGTMTSGGGECKCGCRKRDKSGGREDSN